jgi:glycosyltransferase involved in cell wall biosynthesis
MTSKGGIASVLAGYAEAAALFRTLGYELSFSGTCGRGVAERVSKFASAWFRIVIGAISGSQDIVHIHTATRGSLVRKWILAATCMCLRQKYVIHIHNGAMERYLKSLPSLYRKAVAFVWKRAALIVCLSRDMHDWLTQRGGYVTERCSLIYNGISDPSISDVTRASPGGTTTILFLGKLVEAKGVTSLLDAAATLARNGHRYNLLVGGNGDVQSFLDEVERRNLTQNVTYLGWVSGDRKTQLLANADLFVLPSRSEGFPVSIIEAMAFETAIVSTAIPGVMDAITHGHDGLLVPPDDSGALAHALSSLLTAPSLRAGFASAARRRFLECFTIEGTAAALDEAYRQILK